MEQQFNLPINRLYTLLAKRRREGHRIIDLISGNVNAQGIHFPAQILKTAMAAGMQAAKNYRPDPLGRLAARQAISRHSAREGWRAPPEQIVLTPGTSFSYWYAFKLLTNPGDAILCPTPSYPLFESIAALCGVKLTSYRLREAQRWEIDFDDLESAIAPETKAIILISPHNPTGSVATPEEIRRLAEIAIRRNLAIISDEVFSPFVYRSPALPRPASTRAPLVITLNGFSKMLALPGMKIGWMVVTGEPSWVKKSLKTLEMISDTFLPVHEGSQFAVPHLLKKSRLFRKSYVADVTRRMDAAVGLLEGQRKVTFVKPEGGFFLTLRLEAAGADEESVAYRLLQNHGILVHPGYFYDMKGHHIVFSFVSRPPLLRKALCAILEEIQEGTKK